MTEPYRASQLLVIDSLPSGGKSTIRELYDEKRDWESLSSDEIREELGYEATEATFEKESIMWQMLYVRLMDYLKDGKNVVTDTCPRNQEERRKYFGVPNEEYRGLGIPMAFYEEVLPSLGLDVEKKLLWVEVDRETIDDRNKKRNRDPEVSDRIVDYLVERTEDPENDEIKDYKLIRVENNTPEDFLRLQKILEEETGVNLKPYVEL